MMPLKACLPTMSWSEILMMLLPDMPAAAAILLQKSYRTSQSPVPQALASIGQDCLFQLEGISLHTACMPHLTRNLLSVLVNLGNGVSLTGAYLDAPLLSGGCVCGAAPSMSVETGFPRWQH